MLSQLLDKLLSHLTKIIEEAWASTIWQASDEGILEEERIIYIATLFLCC